MNKGIFYALGAYMFWGILPVYWKELHALPPLEISAHRVVWSLVLLAGILSYRRHWPVLGAALRNRKIVMTFVGASALLLTNWLVYIWAVNAGHILDTSLGYFMNPLVNVLLGVVFLHERLRPWQWAAIGVAATGVLYLALGYGGLPWIAPTLAVTFGLYGLLNKTAALDALEGLSLEMAIMGVPMAAYLIYLSYSGAGALGHANLLTTVLLFMAGGVTTVPLLLFSAGARRVPLSLLGLLQYIAPTMQFVLGVLVYHEPFTHTRLAGFSLIWTALALYALESLFQKRRLSLAVQREKCAEA